MSDIRVENVTKVYDGGVTAVAGISLTVPEREFMVLVGPSGCGKTTLLRMIAGLERVTTGSIHIGERNVTHVAPPNRDIAMVFQNYALYPHKSVRENLAFGLRQRRTPKPEINRRVGEVAEMLGLHELLTRKPGQLSGGQKQRVAIGRALVREPQAFLLDEPLSNLDAKLRTAMRTELARLHKRVGVTTVYVTHDQVEAMTLGDRVAVLRDGLIQQCGPPQELYNAPCNLFVAAFIGSPAMNLVRGTVDGHRLQIGEHALTLSAAPSGRDIRGDVVVGVRPGAFVADGPRVDPEWARLEVDVDLVERLGDETRAFFAVEAEGVDSESVRAASEGGDSGRLLVSDRRARFTACLDARADVAPGRRASLAIDPRELHFFDAASGEALARAPEQSGAVAAAG